MGARVTCFADDVRVKLLDDLVKVFLDEEPMPSLPEVELSALRNDRLSFQVAVAGADGGRRHPGRFARLALESPLAEYMTLRMVEYVPVQYPANPNSDPNYLRKTAGLYPDLLLSVEGNVMPLSDGRWRAAWVDVELPADLAPGAYPAVLSLLDAQSGEALARVELEIQALPFVLPEQTFPRTEWFHADCLADYYGVPVFSEAHWDILGRYIEAAVRRGINMILTPQFTPPLDTAVGHERTTVQLVDVALERGEYRFDFSKLRRWIGLCLDKGVKYFEMSHLFSQWGAVAAPKVVATVDGVEQTLFGWDTPAVGGAYTDFLRRYLPRLRAVLREYGVEERTYFHISDEPHQDQLDSYRAARESVAEALAGCRFLEALSDYDFYRHGLVDHPVCGTDRIGPYLEHGTPGLWCYYCTAQSGHVSNCFIAQSSGCTRVYGAQLYKFDIAGSLRWGYNFYNTADSYARINPFLVTDSGLALPAGDPFLVYPGPGGEPQESIRLLVLDDAIRDLRALRALERRIGREATLALVDEGLDAPLTFEAFPDYPDDAPYVLRLRRRVNAALCAGT